MALSNTRRGRAMVLTQCLAGERGGGILNAPQGPLAGTETVHICPVWRAVGHRSPRPPGKGSVPTAHNSIAKHNQGMSCRARPVTRPGRLSTHEPELVGYCNY